MWFQTKWSLSYSNYHKIKWNTWCLYFRYLNKQGGPTKSFHLAWNKDRYLNEQILRMLLYCFERKFEKIWSMLMAKNYVDDYEMWSWYNPEKHVARIQLVCRVECRSLSLFEICVVNPTLAEKQLMNKFLQK